MCKLDLGKQAVDYTLNVITHNHITNSVMKKITRVFLLLLLPYLYSAQNWQWARQAINSPGASEGYGACVDPSGNAIITGYFEGPTAVFGNYTLSTANVNDFYVVKYDPNGNVLWAKSSNGSGNGLLTFGVCCDASGNIFVTGIFGSTLAVLGTYTLTRPAGGEDVFIVKYDPNGNVLWARRSQGGAVAGNAGNSVSADQAGNVFIAGAFSSPTLSFGTYTLTNTGYSNIFLTKYDTNGNVLWAKSAGGQGGDAAYTICTDAGGNAFIAGAVQSSTVAFGSYTLSNTGNTSAFLTKYDGAGNELWIRSSVYTNTNNTANAYGVACDASGNAYITGNFTGTVSFGSYTLGGPTSANVFLVKYNSGGTELWARGNSSGEGTAFSVSTFTGGVFVAGGGMNVAISFGSYTLTATGNVGDDMFLVQYDSNGNISNALTIEGGGDDEVVVCTDHACNAYISGDFVPNPFVIGSTSLTNVAGETIFIAKFSYTSTNCPEIINTIPEDPLERTRLFVYPNPGKGSIKVETNPLLQNASIILLDFTGKEIRAQKIISDSDDIDTNGLPAGLYTCNLFCNGRKVNSVKLMVE
jgi:hypothetical protein